MRAVQLPYVPEDKDRDVQLIRAVLDEDGEIWVALKDALYAIESSDSVAQALYACVKAGDRDLCKEVVLPNETGAAVLVTIINQSVATKMLPSLAPFSQWRGYWAKPIPPKGYYQEPPVRLTLPEGAYYPE